MDLDREKFKALVHYICWKCKDPEKLGSVKLNKILWVCDFSYFYRYGTPLTGARHVKRQFGPVPHAIIPILGELVAEGALTVTDVRLFDSTKKEFRSLREPELTAFTEEELRVFVDPAIRLITQEHTGKSVSEVSHDHIWHAAQDGEEIPYFTIFARPGDVMAEEIEWASGVLEEQRA